MSSSTSKKTIYCFRFVHSCGTKLTSETRATAKVSEWRLSYVYNVYLYSNAQSLKGVFNVIACIVYTRIL